MKVFLGISGVMLLGIMGVPGKNQDEAIAAIPALPAPAAATAAVVIEQHASSVDPWAVQLEQQQDRLRSLRWARDPFIGPLVVAPIPQAPIVAEVALPELPRLSGLSIANDRPCAILDREIASPGQVLNSGWTVQVIEKGLVTLRFENEVRVLQLGGDS